MCNAFFEVRALQAGQHLLLRPFKTRLSAFQTSASYTCRLTMRIDRGLTVHERQVYCVLSHFLHKCIARIDFGFAQSHSSTLLAASIILAESNRSSAFACPTRRGSIHAHSVLFGS